jgi:D-alanyl-lipoteichoic acid acyltransferase DltB (MBOAT superfamily)
MTPTELVDKLMAWLTDFLRYDPQHPMMFNTGLFLGTFLVFLGIYISTANRKTVRVAYVTIFSLFFYYKASGLYFLLLLLSTLIDYTFGLLIYIHHGDETPYRRKRMYLGRHATVIDLDHWFAPGPETFQVKDPNAALSWIISRIGRGLQPAFELFLTGLNRLVDRTVPNEARGRRRHVFLVMSVLANLGLLIYFKYTNFLITTFNTFLSEPLDPVNILLPVGISFFTFQTMSYTIDIYRGKLEPINNVMDFAFYVSFFPQLVAGPIVRAADFIPQIRAELHVSREDVGRALLLIATGAFKKLVISDYISTNFVDRIFEAPGLYSGFENLMGVYGYALQIYCDFSGYTDMAIGIGLLMGYRLPLNFRAPYQAKSVQDFWRRWHISLSTWLRDYLYISLGGNRKGQARTYFNLLATMFLGGLWHGAAWTFILWGTLHGVALALHRMLTDTRHWLSQKFGEWLDRLDERATTAAESEHPDSMATRISEWRWRMQSWLPLLLTILGRFWGVIATFHFVCFTWIFFRARSFEQAIQVIDQIINNFQPQLAWEVWSGYREVFALMLLGYLMHFIPEQVEIKWEQRFVYAPVLVKSLALGVVLYFVLVLQTQSTSPQPFIYFQF